MFVCLTAAMGLTLGQAALVTGAIVLVCAPASLLLARWIDGQRHAFTAAGAVFVATIVLPPAVMAIGAWTSEPGRPLPTLAVLAAAAVSYTLGEGLGRLAYISFGCCCGKPLDQLPRWLARWFARHHFVFVGETEKIAYASGMAGVRVVPIQALTSVVFVAAALLGTLLLLHGRSTAALVGVVVITHVWRSGSEVLWADWRGGGRLSACQAMAIVGIAVVLVVVGWLGEAPLVRLDLAAGLGVLWSPWPIAGLELLWTSVFVFSGWSKTTESAVALRLRS